MLSDKSRQGPSNPNPGKAEAIDPIQTKKNFKAMGLIKSIGISTIHWGEVPNLRSESPNALKFLFKHKPPHADIHQQTDTDRSG